MPGKLTGAHTQPLVVIVVYINVHNLFTFVALRKWETRRQVEKICLMANEIMNCLHPKTGHALSLSINLPHWNQGTLYLRIGYYGRLSC